MVNRWAEKERKEWMEREAGMRNGEHGKDRSLCCIIWQGTSPMLSDGGVRMISLTHTRALSVCLSLFPLVSFQSTDQPLADRTGPLGSCYRRPQQRLKGLDSCSVVPTVSGKSVRISHWIRYLRQKEKRKAGNRAEMENERQVRHLVRVKEGKHEEEKTEREWQRLSKREKNAERDKRKMKCESLSYCLPAVYQGRQ